MKKAERCKQGDDLVFGYNSEFDEFLRNGNKTIQLMKFLTPLTDI